MTAVSPGQVARFQGNEYYRSDEEYLWTLGSVLKDEYKAIADAGFILQLDCPDLGSGWNGQFRNLTLEQFHKVVDMHLEVLDAAVADIPPDKVRLHLCWGNYEGPHNHDIPLHEIFGPVLKSRPGAVSFEGANPRHEHEWAVFEEVKLPDGKLVNPGVIDSTTNFIEHPEVVAQRIERYAAVVGRENVIAGADCGFATFANAPTVVPTITWAKWARLSKARESRAFDSGHKTPVDMNLQSAARAYQTAAAIALPSISVSASPPISGVRGPFTRTASMAATTASAASGWPR